MAKVPKEHEVPSEQDVNIGFDDDSSLSPEEAQAKIATMLAKSENLETLSETTEEEVRLMSALVFPRTAAKFALPCSNSLAFWIALPITFVEVYA